MKSISTLLCALLLAGIATQASAASLLGVWLGPNFSVAITPCSDHGQEKFCGKIVSLTRPLDAQGRPITDARNPNPALRSHPLVGSTFLSGFSPTGEGHWEGGKIYNPDDGRTYSSKLTLLAGDQLSVEGCVLILCKAQIWRRAGTR